MCPMPGSFNRILFMLVIAGVCFCGGSIAFIPEAVGNQSATGKGQKSAGLTAKVPELQPKSKFKLPGQFAGERHLQLSADGKRLGITYHTPDYKSFTQVWDLSAGPKVLSEFSTPAFVLSPSGKRLLGIPYGPILDVESKKEMARVPDFVSFGFFRNEDTVVATGRSHMFTEHAKGKVTVWNVAKNADAGSFEVPDNRFQIAFPAKNGKEYWLFMSNEKFEVECYDLEGKKLARTIKPQPDDPKTPYRGAGISIATALDGSVFASNVRKPLFYDGQSGKILGNLPEDLWSSSSEFLAGKSSWYVARPAVERGKKREGFAETDHIIYDWKAGKAIAALCGHSSGQQDSIAAASADARVAVSATKGGEVLMFDISSLK